MVSAKRAKMLGAGMEMKVAQKRVQLFDNDRTLGVLSNHESSSSEVWEDEWLQKVDGKF